MMQVLLSMPVICQAESEIVLQHPSYAISLATDWFHLSKEQSGDHIPPRIRAQLKSCCHLRSQMKKIIKTHICTSKAAENVVWYSSLIFESYFLSYKWRGYLQLSLG